MPDQLTPDLPSADPGVGSSALLACLRRMRASVQTRITFYKESGDDPYQIHTALMVAMLELDGMLAEQIEYLGKQANAELRHSADSDASQQKKTNNEH